MILEFIKKNYAALLHLILFRTSLIPFNDGLFINKKHRKSVSKDSTVSSVSVTTVGSVLVSEGPSISDKS